MQKHSMLVAFVAALTIVGGISAREYKKYKKHTKQAPEMTKEDRAKQVIFHNYEGIGMLGRQAFTLTAKYNRGEIKATVQPMHEQGDKITLLYDGKKGSLQYITITSPETTKVTTVKAENLRGDCNEYNVKFDDKTKIWVVEKKEVETAKESTEKTK